MLRLPAALLAVGLLGAHALAWGRASLLPVFGSLAATGLLFLAYVASIPSHEALHVAGYRAIGRVPPGAAGVSVRGLMAYAHCSAPMPARAYRISLALPGVVLGVLPAAIGLATGLAWPTAFGAFALGGALADARVIWALRDVPASAPVLFCPAAGAYEVGGGEG
jgi:hypothetical protein